MKPTQKEGAPKCSVLDCEEKVIFLKDKIGYATCCQHHLSGGMFGKGESFERYQIIESDFLVFVKTVPLHQDHFSVYSNVLRDIILRTCVEIEIFFKEWGRYEYTDQTSGFKLHTETIRKTKKPVESKDWKIKDYYFFATVFEPIVHVRQLSQTLHPFIDWKENKPPKWWSAYNKIKHDGHLYYKMANYENALNALAALFQLHCTQLYSLQYLGNMTPLEINKTYGFSKSELMGINPDITTPIGSMHYLFSGRDTGGRMLQKFFNNETERHNQIIYKIGFNL